VKVVIAAMVMVLVLALGALEIFAARGVSDARVPGGATAESFSAAW
jgi:hypothetical protein